METSAMSPWSDMSAVPPKMTAVSPAVGTPAGVQLLPTSQSDSVTLKNLTSARTAVGISASTTTGVIAAASAARRRVLPVELDEERTAPLRSEVLTLLSRAEGASGEMPARDL